MTDIKQPGVLAQECIDYPLDTQIVDAAIAWHTEALDMRLSKLHLMQDSPGHSHRVHGVWNGDNGKYAGMRCAQCHLWGLLCERAAIAQEVGK